MEHEYVSYSRISQYLSCGYKYDFIYNKGLVPRMDDATPTVGSVGHKVLAAIILGGTMDATLDDWQEGYIKTHTIYDDKGRSDPDMNHALKEMTGVIIEIVSEIIPMAVENLHLEEWETVVWGEHPLVEAKFMVPIPGFRGLNFVLDWVAKHKPTGHTWAIDHKFRKQFRKDEVEEMDLQMPIYQKGLSTIGIPTVGSMSNQILAKVPSIPSRNKDGSMSRVKIATTWDKYKAELIKCGLNPNDYLDMRDKLTTEFNRRTYVYRNQGQLDATWDNIVLPVVDHMVNTPSYVRNLGCLSCRNCWLNDYCMEELRGGDLKFLMNDFMQRNVDHHDDLILNLMDKEEEGEE